jgi:hypothetical protein
MNIRAPSGSPHAPSHRARTDDQVPYFHLTRHCSLVALNTKPEPGQSVQRKLTACDTRGGRSCGHASAIRVKCCVGRARRRDAAPEIENGIWVGRGPPYNNEIYAAPVPHKFKIRPREILELGGTAGWSIRVNIEMIPRGALSCRSAKNRVKLNTL